ncbi:chemotaxis protein CheW [soil metagenome]
MEEVSEKKASPVESTVQLIVFRMGGESYGIRIEQIREVTITPEITRMPKTPSFIKGIANIRGDIIAIMDLEERFYIKSASPAKEDRPANTYTLVTDIKEYTIGLVVKEVPQSLNLPVSKMDKTPAFLQDSKISESFIEGIGKLDNRLIIVLDIYKILTSQEIKELKGEK